MKKYEQVENNLNEYLNKQGETYISVSNFDNL